MGLNDKQREMLNADLPQSVVAKRDGGGGKKLSYVEGWWVIDELNRIFGNGGWSYRATVERVHEGQNEKGQYVCTYLGRCVLTVGDCVIEDVGAGQGQDKNAGAAIEKAAKEAATDSLKRCAKSLGRHLGLAIYDKEQTHVSDEPAPPAAVSDEAAIMIAMLEHEPAEAKKQIKAAWQKLSAVDRAAITDAVEQQKNRKAA